MRRGGEPVAISKILREVLARRGLAGGSVQLRMVQQAFAVVAGERLVGRTRVAGLRGGTVTIETDTPALAFELRGFEGARLLNELRRQPGAEFVKQLKFTAGAGLHGR